MPATTIRWLKGKQFEGTDSHGQSILLSGDDETEGVRPSQAMLIALGSCSSVDVVEVLRKRRMPLKSLDVTVTGEQDKDPPWAYRKVHIHFRLIGDNLKEKAVARTIRLAEEHYCSVAATMRGVAEITTDFEIIEDISGEAT
jgi:putative redox protein